MSQTSLTTDEKLAKTRQKILNIGDNDGFPNPENLSDSDKETYEQLKEHYLYLKNMEKAQEKLQ